MLVSMQQVIALVLLIYLLVQLVLTLNLILALLIPKIEHQTLEPPIMVLPLLLVVRFKLHLKKEVFGYHLTRVTSVTEERTGSSSASTSDLVKQFVASFIFLKY